MWDDVLLLQILLLLLLLLVVEILPIEEVQVHPEDILLSLIAELDSNHYC